MGSYTQNWIKHETDCCKNRTFYSSFFVPKFRKNVAQWQTETVPIRCNFISVMMSSTFSLPNSKHLASSRNTIPMTIWIMPKFWKPLEPFIWWPPIFHKPKHILKELSKYMKKSIRSFNKISIIYLYFIQSTSNILFNLFLSNMPNNAYVLWNFGH